VQSNDVFSLEKMFDVFPQSILRVAVVKLKGKERLMSKLETKCLHAGYSPEATTKSQAVPLYRTAAYRFDSTEHAANLFALKELGNIYTRLMNPTTDVLEQRVAAMEGGAAALAVASGTSAIFYSIINLAQSGDEIVSANNLYGGSYTQFNDILPSMGITVNFVDPSDPKNFEAAITEKTKAVFCETIGNPGLELADIKDIADVAHAHGLPLIVDSTFTSPALLRPIEHGADIVVHSLTKWLGGHGTAIGGIVVDSGKFDWTTGKHPLLSEPDPSYHDIRYATDLGDLAPLAYILRMRLVPLRNLGAALSPDNAWMALQGIETLPLRMERHSENGLAVADYLKGNDKVEWVKYAGYDEKAGTYLPDGAGGMVVFEIKGGEGAGRTFIESLELFSHLANVGDAKSLAIHPASTTHSQLTVEQQAAGGITPGLIRLSVGLEHIDDILSDIKSALAKI
jgi:O-acetylhomoserine (thiol)-lyase